MFKTLKIENFKSIEKLSMELGRVNVLVGENGAGKSNILEAIALAGAAEAKKLDNEFLASRGIRVSGAALMRSAFDKAHGSDAISISLKNQEDCTFRYKLTNDNKPYSSWKSESSGVEITDVSIFKGWVDDIVNAIPDREGQIKFLESFRDQLKTVIDGVSESSSDLKFSGTISLKANTKAPIKPRVDAGGLEDFIIFSPENSALRAFDREGQIEPLGVNGEGLLKFLTVVSKNRNKDTINSIIESLKLFSWFSDLRIKSAKTQSILEIFDHYLAQGASSFDQRSANEGFLFLAFYFSLFSSNLTPKFFAIDNIDSSLNPKLCHTLMARLSLLAASHSKQVILTTHNPAILDGINLDDPQQRLFIVSRSTSGKTRVRRFSKKPASDSPRRLSELFISGALGGLPKGF